MIVRTRSIRSARREGSVALLYNGTSELLDPRPFVNVVTFPDWIFDAETCDPAKQQVPIRLFHQLAFRADRAVCLGCRLPQRRNFAVPFMA
jgi:hypothetical protein